MGLDPDLGAADEEVEFDLEQHNAAGSGPYDDDDGGGGDNAMGGPPKMSADELSDVVMLNYVSDVDEIPLDFDARDFQEVFDVNHEDSDVTVHSIVNLIVIFRYGKRRGIVILPVVHFLRSLSDDF